MLEHATNVGHASILPHAIGNQLDRITIVELPPTLYTLVAASIHHVRRLSASLADDFDCST